MKEPVFYKEKIVGFVDILGFSPLVKGESSKGANDIMRIISKLGTDNDRENYQMHKSPICPDIDKINKNLSFEMTQISDCVIVSAEKSLSGAINIFDFCQKVAVRLLFSEQLLCRGYIAVGDVYHTKYQVFGPGYQAAVEGEKTAAGLKFPDGLIGAPFIEIDNDVLKLLEGCDDRCVKKMMQSSVTKMEDFAVISPYGLFNRRMNWATDGSKNKREAVKELREAIRIAQCLIEKMKLSQPLNDGGKMKVDIAIEELDRAIENLESAIEMANDLPDFI